MAGAIETVSFAVTLYDDGRVDVDYGTVLATAGLVGTSVGGGVADPGGSDLSSLGQPIATAPARYEVFAGPVDLDAASLALDPVTTDSPRPASPTALLAALTGETGGFFAPSVDGFLVDDPDPVLAAVSRNAVVGAASRAVVLVEPIGVPRDSVVGIRVEGVNTEFDAGSTLVVDGDGVIVSGVVVESPTVLTAELTIDDAATLGARDVTVTTPGVPDAEGSELVTITEPWEDPMVLGVLPRRPVRGSTPTLRIYGQGTSFGGSSIVDLGPGVQVDAITALGPELLEVDVTVSPTAAVGLRDVTVMTGSEEAYEDDDGPLFVTAVPNSLELPAVVSVTPGEGVPGDMVEVTVVGEHATFVEGTSALSFTGFGVVVLESEVTSPTTMTAMLQIVEPTLGRGVRSVRVATGDEVAVGFDLFRVGSSPEALFEDGFDGGDPCQWPAVVAGPTCPGR